MTETPQRNTILIVDDEVTNINFLVHLLRRDYTLYVAKNGPDAIEMASRHVPDLILLDIIMPEMSGYEVLETLKYTDETKNIPVVFVTGLDGRDDEEKGLALDAVDYISKPLKDEVVRLRVRNQIKIVNAMRTIEKLSLMDPLTGLPNRRHFNEQLSREWARAVRSGNPISLAVMDIDFFKRYNDTYGHPQGDVLLQALARVFLNSANRATDFVARWGGEEFVMLFPLSDSEGAFLVAERIRENVEEMEVLLEDGGVTKVTISLGVNSLIPTMDGNMSQLLAGADKALYAAKRKGRNVTVMADGITHTSSET